ncbi:MAG: hypothetical protein AB7G48_05210 [Nitrospiraceae bacterium]
MGGKIYERAMDVGANNTRWVLDFMRQEGFVPAKMDLGDVHPHKVYFFAQTGRLLVKKIERIKNDTIFAREAEHRKQLQRETEASDVTLF